MRQNEDKNERIKRYEIMATIFTPNKLYCTSVIPNAKERIPVNEIVFNTIKINAKSVLIFFIFLDLFYYYFFVIYLFNFN